MSGKGDPQLLMGKINLELRKPLVFYRIQSFLILSYSRTCIPYGKTALVKSNKNLLQCFSYHLDEAPSEDI